MHFSSFIKLKLNDELINNEINNIINTNINLFALNSSLDVENLFSFSMSERFVGIYSNKTINARPNELKNMIDVKKGK